MKDDLKRDEAKIQILITELPAYVHPTVCRTICEHSENVHDNLALLHFRQAKAFLENRKVLQHRYDVHKEKWNFGNLSPRWVIASN